MKQDDNSHWITISDMMSGLMAVFLFISVAYMSKTQQKTKGYLDLKGDMLKSLKEEFKADLESWNAEIDDESLTIRFKSLDSLFDTGNSIPKNEFKQVIDNFFPRYAKLLYSAEYRSQIEEIRIEGHTSSAGQFKEQTIEDNYQYNLELSQARSRNVLRIAMGGLGESNLPLKDWLRSNLTANGLSFSKPIFVPNTTTEDLEKSKRVEFRVRLKADQVIESIEMNK